MTILSSLVGQPILRAVQAIVDLRKSELLQKREMRAVAKTSQGHDSPNRVLDMSLSFYCGDRTETIDKQPNTGLVLLWGKLPRDKRFTKMIP